MRVLVTTPHGVQYRELTAAEQAAHEKDVREQDVAEAIAENKSTAQQLLNDTDWTQVADCGLTAACAESFRAYRAALRTIRRGDAADVVFPARPTQVWA